MNGYMDLQYFTYERRGFVVNVAQLPSGAWLATVCRRLNPGYPSARYGEPTATTQLTKYKALHRALEIIR
ncbi:hypothetical protein DRQ50_00180 [bacterium]|nr:MAG: hypothetical protein DRQ50_00180 [bacterium]